MVDEAHEAAARFLGATPEEVGFGANMTTLNFALSRTAARDWKEGDEVVVTRLDHDANVAPWLELARDLDLVVRFVDVDDECRLVLADLERQLSSRTRVVAFPWASNAVGTVTDVSRIVDLAHGPARSSSAPPRSGAGTGRVCVTGCSCCRRPSGTPADNSRPGRRACSPVSYDWSTAN